ncbi:MAG: DUF1540 domain-containing protein [Aeriscardovia sp.]|nr:DUF1540 domain-containing protein [Prevotella sp.]MBO5628939.1 DUF1540 domain-containing protein [Aeriscardovia sp.]
MITFCNCSYWCSSRCCRLDSISVRSDISCFAFSRVATFSLRSFLILSIAECFFLVSIYRRFPNSLYKIESPCAAAN